MEEFTFWNFFTEYRSLGIDIRHIVLSIMNSASLE
jgi:hypothetical protein